MSRGKVIEICLPQTAAPYGRLFKSGL